MVNGAATLPIVATNSGYITAINVGAGSYINDNTSTMMTLSNLDQVIVSANIPENSLGNIHAGQATNIMFPAYPGQVFHGTVNSVSSVLDSDSRRSKARIVLANAGMKFKPNMFATVEIETSGNGQMSVPQSALLMNNDEVTVFVEVKPNTYMRKVVTLGNEDDNNVQILSGLAPTDRVVISGGVLLND
jgi:cobalt-zinc-cadmium efflux system membrane fusion protein